MDDFLFCLYILEGKSYIYFWSFQQTGLNTLYSFTINLCYNIFPRRFKPKVPSWWNLQSLLGILLMQVSWTEIGSSDSAMRFSDPAKIVTVSSSSNLPEAGQNGFPDSFHGNHCAYSEARGRDGLQLMKSS